MFGLKNGYVGKNLPQNGEPQRFSLESKDEQWSSLLFRVYIVFQDYFCVMLMMTVMMVIIMKRMTRMRIMVPLIVMVIRVLR